MNDDPDYHRTFEKFSTNKLGMWPEFKHSESGWNFRGHDTYRREHEEKVAAKVSAFYAYRRLGTGLERIRLMPKPGQDFASYATEWEDTYSTLTPNWRQRVEPIVDDRLKVVGHYGKWGASEILYPTGAAGGINIVGMIAAGVPVYASDRNPMPSYYSTLYSLFGAPEWTFTLLTGPDGRVESIFLKDVGQGAVATMAPWEAISIARGAVTLVGTSRRYVIDMVRRGERVGGLAAGPTRDAALAAANQASAQVAQSGTVRAAHVGTFGAPGHLIARIEIEQGRVIYRVASIHLKAQGNAAEAAARVAHRNMLTRAAQEAQKRGHKEFTLRGIDANQNFRAHADKLASGSGVPGSGKALPGSADGFTSYEVTLDAAKVLSLGAKQAAPKAAAGASSGAAGGQGARRTVQKS